MSSPPAPRISLKGAFTLLELLVAVTIIGILAALIFPVAGMVRANQESVRCLQNLKAIGTGFHLYAADNGNKCLPRLLNWYTTDQRPPGDRITWYQRLYIYEYIKDTRTFYCPSFTPRSGVGAIRMNTAGGDTYAIRSWIVPGKSWEPNSEEHKPFTAIGEPSKFFLIVDSVWLSSKTQGYGVTPGLDNQRIHTRHSGFANTLFADGHVEQKAADYFKTINSRQVEYGLPGREFAVQEKATLE